MPTRLQELHQLAQLYNIQTSYYDITGKVQTASPESLLKVLAAMGAPIGPSVGASVGASSSESSPINESSPIDVSSTDLQLACRERRQKMWARPLEPVTVVWDGSPAYISLRLPANKCNATADFRLNIEGEGHTEWQCDLGTVKTETEQEIEGIQYHVKHIDLPGILPAGYHNVTVSLPGCSTDTTLICAPPEAYHGKQEYGGQDYGGQDYNNRGHGAQNCGKQDYGAQNDPARTWGAAHTWGIFLPLHALHSSQSLGVGDFADLASLLNWVYKQGGKYVGTLPLLPVFLDNPYDHSPYAPASRLFWDEFFLDIRQIPEFKHSAEAQELISTPEMQREIRELQNNPLVDYQRSMQLKRRILASLARYCSVSPTRDAALKQWATANPTARDYARFRAAGEKQNTGWPEWPQHMQEGNIHPGDYRAEDEYYHLYVQWLADEQLSSLAAQFKGPGQGIYMDLPLGVHHDSYDVWRRRDLFALDVGVGAPPDPFSDGQNWGFPPLHPEKIRQDRYRYFIAMIRHHLKYAGLLRIDHIMGLHRLYWIPRGLATGEGVYVKYRAEEFYAILNLESHRNKTALIGEDLGTVPEDVRPAMNRHNINKMYVLPFEGKNPVPEKSLACLNTHDMVPFASYWLQKNIGERWDFARYLQEKNCLADTVIADTTINVGEIMRASLKLLARSEARYLLINLEDLWLETAPQNIPGTNTYPNWQRKARYSLEDLVGVDTSVVGADAYAAKEDTSAVGEGTATMGGVDANRAGTVTAAMGGVGASVVGVVTAVTKTLREVNELRTEE